jgi:ABC-2 type transport system permease protein
MDFYRMLHTKSLYVIWLVLFGVTLLTTAFAKVDYDMQNEAETVQEAASGTDASKDIQIGIYATVPTDAGEKISLFDMFYSNVQSKALAVFFVIFAVLFSTADLNSGYIKNIGGQVRHKSMLVLSKAVVLFLYTFISMVIFTLMQLVSCLITFGYVKLGNAKEFLIYAVVELVLYYALMLICMTLSILIRNNVFSMIIVTCLCMNVTQLIYSGIDMLVKKMGVHDFSCIKYTITGKIALLSMTPDKKSCIAAIAVSAVFGAVMLVLGCVSFERRDI